MTAITRRGAFRAIGSIATASIIAVQSVTASADAELLAAWNERQSALAKIEARGAFYWCETHSPKLAARFDRAEMQVYTLPASTPRGILAKLWVALSHMGGVVRNEDERAHWCAIRRADFAEVQSFAAEFDFDCSTVWSAIVSLNATVEG